MFIQNYLIIWNMQEEWREENTSISSKKVSSDVVLKTPPKTQGLNVVVNTPYLGGPS
jgi:hypothetical protein